MGIMDAIKRMSAKKNESKEKFKEMQEDFRLNKMLEERQKSSNLRELEKHYKDKEEAQVKVALDKIRKVQTKDNWKHPNTVLDKGKSILANDYLILKDKNLFMNNKNIFMGNKHNSSFSNSQGGFFKW